VARHLDFATLQRMPGSFVDEALQRSETDVLFEARHDADRAVYVYVLVEHQSTVDFWLRLWLLRYQSRIWEEERAGARERARSARL
jgi:predicted transposase YdaD